MQLYAQHARNHAAVNALGAPDREGEEHPLQATYSASREAVQATRPQTMEGVLAKARMADLKHFVPREDACDWAGIVVRDLLWVTSG